VTDGADAGTKPGLGIYLYGIVPAGFALATRAPGVDPSHSPFAIEHAGLTAIVSEVSLDEFGDEALKANLEQLEWLEACARTHEGVLEGALEVTTVLPARLATIYTNEDHVRRLLEREHDVLAAQLEDLRNTREWGVKGFVDEETLLRWLEASDDELRRLRNLPGPTTEGAAYLARKRYDLLARERAGDVKARCADTIHSALARHAERAERKPRTGGAPMPDGAEPLLNGAYLVGREEETRFLSAFRELADRHGALGVRLDVTGPWPAYSFVTAVGRSQ
jgi:hypothetical protein